MMNNNISDMLLTKVSDLIVRQIGLHFPEQQLHILKRGLGFAASDFGFAETEALGRWLLSAPMTKDRVARLAGHLTIGETYFFRDMSTFDALRDHVLPTLLLNRKDGERRLRIWSAGCSTGEEAYSLAILLTRMIPDLTTWKVALLATDVNPSALEKASQGVYSDWSFRHPPVWLKNQYFSANAAGFTIRPDIKRMVTFAPLNLVEDGYPALTNNTNAMDIIFCRNVLMYFPEQVRDRVIRNFQHALVDGGWLVVSPSESNKAIFPQFVAVNFPGTMFFLNATHPQTVQPTWFARTARMNDVPALAPNRPASDNQPGAPIPQKKNATAQAEVSKLPETTAVTLYAQGRYEEVVAMLETAAGRLTTDDIELLTRAYANQGQFAQALQGTGRLLALDKLNANFYYLRATILLEQQQDREAEQMLKRVLYLDPNFVLAYFALANLYRTQRRLRETEKHLEIARRLLQNLPSEAVLPESEGLTAGRLLEIISAGI